MPLIAELKRRNVFRVGVAYAIVAWLLIEVASVLLPTFDVPDWVMQAFSSLVILGFPLALIFAWAFEMTPQGLKRTEDVPSAESTTHLTGRKVQAAASGPDAEVSSIRSLAVLPFVNMSGDPDQEYLLGWDYRGAAQHADCDRGTSRRRSHLLILVQGEGYRSENHW